MSAAGSASQGKKRKNFNTLEREEVIRYLLASSKDGVRQHGSYPVLLLARRQRTTSSLSEVLKFLRFRP